MKQPWRQRTGFTLVELLIVIVVIAILAAISIVAYNGIQKRATETRVSAIVDSYAKMLKMYQIEHGSFPIRSSEVCLGDPSDFPADDIFDAGACVRHTSSGETRALVDPDLANSLSVYGDLPDSELPRSSYWGSEDWRGLRYYAHDGTYAYMEWILNGRSDSCAPGKVFGADDNYTMCNMRVR